jgi:murein DD-endopeptidase MepM/ murein hydrolase activator NlpD
MQIKITGSGLRKYQQQPGTVDPNDAWIRKILEYEASQGSAAGTGLSNWGYNSRNPKNIEEAIGFFKQDYLPKVQQFPMGLRERLGDYTFNTGRNINDLLLYAAGKISLVDINSPNVFTDKWKLYGNDILKEYEQNPSQFLWKLDKAKHDVYSTTKPVNGKTNPAYGATWAPRTDMWGIPAPANVSKPTNTSGTPGLPYFPELNNRPIIDENTIDRPPSNTLPYDFIGPETEDQEKELDPITKAAWEQAQRDAPIMGVSAEELMKMRQKTITTTTTTAAPFEKRSGIIPATAIIAGLQGIGSALTNANDAARREQYRIQSGRTDSYFPTVPNPYSRGIEEINTGEFIPNLRTPVQFPGIPSPEYYGMRQYQIGGGIGTEGYMPGTGALLPAMPASFMDAAVVDSYMSTGQTSAAPVKPSVTTSPELETTMVSRGFALPMAPYTFKRVGSGFGPRKAPTAGASTNHNGVDVGLPLNTPLFSVKDGIVKKVYENSKGGKQLVIFHPDGTRSAMAHLNSWNVKEGDQVKMGQQVALSGNTGISTGPHLHFTYGYHDGEKTTKLIDPNSVFKFNDYIESKKPKDVKINKLASQIISLTEPAGFSNTPTTSQVAVTGRRNVFGGAILSNSNYTPSSNTSNVVNSQSNAQISFTHNNPLNIHYGDFAKGYGGTKGHKDGNGYVAIFQDFDTGIKAAKNLLFGPSYNNLTVSGARKRWVGQEDDSVSYIVKAMGEDKRLKDLTIDEQEKLIKLFAQWEGKQAYRAIKDMDLKPYLKNQYQEGGIFELSDDEIDYILSNGGEVEYL